MTCKKEEEWAPDHSPNGENRVPLTASLRRICRRGFSALRAPNLVKYQAVVDNHNRLSKHADGPLEWIDSNTVTYLVDNHSSIP